MIMLNARIIIQVSDSKQYGLDPASWYQVIGTATRQGQKDGKPVLQDIFVVVNDDGRPTNVFPSKCKIRILKSENNARSPEASGE